MREAIIVDAVRTPIGRAHPDKGWFKDIRSDELGIIVLRELLHRTKIDPAQIEDVILGCATQSGEQAMNIARYISIMAGLPFSPCTTIIALVLASHFLLFMAVFSLLPAILLS